MGIKKEQNFKDTLDSFNIDTVVIKDSEYDIQKGKWSYMLPLLARDLSMWMQNLLL